MPARMEDEDFEDFVDRVDDVEKTIKDLLAGKLDPKEIDAKEEKLQKKKELHEQKKQEKKVKQEQEQRKAVREQERKKWGFVGQWCPRCRRDEIQMRELVYGKDDTKWPQELPEHCITPECEDLKIKLLSNEERRNQLHEKVEDMKAERLRKAMARDRWNRWKSTQQFNRVGAGETDYVLWDKWLPSDDEEDELPPAPPPDTAEFKAMEKDIEERAKSKNERQRKGEQLKNQGNEAMSEGKYMKAFKKYTEGIESDKSGLRLLTNRALACLKLKNKKVKLEKLGEEVEVESYHQCIDDCQKVIDICEFLHNNEGQGVKPARVKAYMRQAAAHAGLEKLEEAVEDIKKALSEIKDLSAPDRKELRELEEKYLSDIAERDRVKKLREMAGINSLEAEGADSKPETKCATATNDELASETETKVGDTDSKASSPDSGKGEKHFKESTGKAATEARIPALSEQLAGQAEGSKPSGAASAETVQEPVSGAASVQPELVQKSVEVKNSSQKQQANATPNHDSNLPKSQMRKIAIIEDDDDEDEDVPVQPKQPTVKPSATALPGEPGAPPKAEVEDFAQKMMGLVGNPQIMKAMQDPKMQKLFGEMTSTPGGMTDDQLLQKYGDDPELVSLYETISKTFTPPPAKKEDTNPKPKDKQKAKVDHPKVQQTAAEAAKAAMGPSPLNGLDPDTMKKLQGDEDLQKALKDPNMSGKFKELLSNPTSIDKLMQDPEFARLESKLQSIMDQATPSTKPSQSAPTSSGPKGLTKEERLKQAVSALEGAKKALASTASQSKESAAADASQHLAKLPELLQDDDVCALLRAQQAVEIFCDVLVRLGGVSAKPALSSLHLLAMEERSSTPLLTHKGGKSLVQVLAWAQGMDTDTGARIPSLSVVEAALQHDELRRKIVGKVWNFTPPGCEEGRRVSVISAAASVLVGPSATVKDLTAVSPALGVLTNALYDDAGKNQVEAMEENGKALFFSVLELASSAPSVRRKALRLLLNASSRASLREAICSLSAVQRIATALKSEVSTMEKAGWSSKEAEVLEAALGVAMNLGLTESMSSQFCQHDMLVPLQKVMANCKVPGCTLRAASAVSRIVKVPETAEEVLSSGLFQVMLEWLKRESLKAQSGDDTTLDTLDAVVRTLAISMKGTAAAITALMNEMENPKALVKLLSCRKEGVVGNAAFALQLIGNKQEHLAALGSAGAVPALLSVVHHKRGPPQKNAALALSRVVKREENMAALKAMHGLEILNAYMRFS